MRSLLGISAILLLCPAAYAQPKSAASAETLLSADSLVYLRFDGLEPHRKAYEQTVLHELLQEDLGDFVGYVTGLLKKYIAQQIQNAENDSVKNALKLVSDPTAILKYAEQNGAALGLEVIGHSPPRWQLTLVFPEGAAKKNKALLLGMLRIMAGLAAQSEIKETTVRGRRITQVHWDPLLDFRNVKDVSDEKEAKEAKPAKQNMAAWWEEGNHIVLIMGTEPLSHALEVCEGKRANLTAAPLYRDVAGFARYETMVRGYVDLPKAVALLGTAKANDDPKDQLKEAFARRLLIRRLGLDGLKSLSLHWGFEGRAQRSTIELGMVEAKSRNGLLRVFASGMDFDAKNLPPLAPDAGDVSVHSIDWQALYDVGLQFARIAEFIQRLEGGEGYTKTPTDFEAIVNKTLEMNLRDNLLKTLGSPVVISKAFSEGPFVLGYSAAIKVNDAKKLQEAIAKLAEPLKKLLADQGGTEIALQKATYRGVTIHTYSAKGVPVSPSYAIHDGWLVVGAYPQTVRAFVLRSAGKRTAWTPPAQTQEALAQSLKWGNDKSRLASVTMSDPRLFLERILPFVPLFVQAIGANNGDFEFDAALIPHTKAITEPLFPNVTVCVDDGTVVRWETRASLDIPFNGVVLLLVISYADGFGF